MSDDRTVFERDVELADVLNWRWFGRELRQEPGHVEMVFANDEAVLVHLPWSPSSTLDMAVRLPHYLDRRFCGIGMITQLSGSWLVQGYCDLGETSDIWSTEASGSHTLPEALVDCFLYVRAHTSAEMTKLKGCC